MMRLPKFSYRTPRTIAEAVKIIGDTGPESQFVAGGTDLYPNMKRRQQMPKTVISVMRLPELNQVSGEGPSGAVIGASMTLTDVIENSIIKRDYPVIASAARTISTPILRNMGTIGGNLLLDTRCNYYDQNYEWRKAINFCLKKDGDGALHNGRATAPVDRDAIISEAKIVLGGIAPSPVQVNEAAQHLIGHRLNDDQIRAAAEAAYIKARPLDNTDFVYQWRKQMA